GGWCKGRRRDPGGGDAGRNTLPAPQVQLRLPAPRRRAPGAATRGLRHRRVRRRAAVRPEALHRAAHAPVSAAGPGERRRAAADRSLRRQHRARRRRGGDGPQGGRAGDGLPPARPARGVHPLHEPRRHGGEAAPLHRGVRPRRAVGRGRRLARGGRGHRGPRTAARRGLGHGRARRDRGRENRAAPPAPAARPPRGLDL
ncbi:MAG: GDP-mannose pyrophosphatase NudK, partial [uncultured Acetobacteraceae bacterium]